MPKHTLEHSVDFEILCRREAEKAGLVLTKKSILTFLRNGKDCFYIIPDIVYEDGAVKIAIEIERMCHHDSKQEANKKSRKELLQEMGYLVIAFDTDSIEQEEAEVCIQALQELIESKRKETGSKTSKVQGDESRSEMTQDNKTKENEQSVIPEKEAPESPESGTSLNEMFSVINSKAEITSKNEGSSGSSDGHVSAPSGEVTLDQNNNVDQAAHQEKILSEKLQHHMKNIPQQEKEIPSEIGKSTIERGIEKKKEKSMTLEDLMGASSSSPSHDVKPEPGNDHVKNEDSLSAFPAKSETSIAEGRYPSDEILMKKSPKKSRSAGFISAMLGSIVTALVFYGYFMFYEGYEKPRGVEPDSAIPAEEFHDSAPAEDLILEEESVTTPEYDIIPLYLPEVDMYLAGKNYDVILSRNEGDQEVLIEIPENSMLVRYRDMYLLRCADGYQLSQNKTMCEETSHPIEPFPEEISEESDVSIDEDAENGDEPPLEEEVSPEDVPVL